MDILQVRELKQSLERRDARILELEQQLEAARQPQERGEAVGVLSIYYQGFHSFKLKNTNLHAGDYDCYAHLPAADARVAELEAQLAASDRHGVYLEELTDAQADRIAALEAQLAETKKAYRSMVDANREASEKLAASREREGRMREAAKLGARWANEYASQMSGYAISEDATEDAEAIEAAVGEPITAQANQSFPASLAAALIDAGWVRIEYDEQTERLEALILKTVCEARAALAADKEGK